MALKKKNVFQGFMQDDYVPSGDQQIVKYLFGKGNNLHEIESPNGSNFLVTMPKKFRQTVWLKKGDCIVIDPISEGKKVLGEIICVVPSKSVVELIKSGEWIPPNVDNLNIKEDINPVDTGGGDAAAECSSTTTTNQKSKIISLEERKNFLIQFYSSTNSKNSSETNDSSCMPPSESEEEEEEDNDEDSSDDDEEEDSIQENKLLRCKGDVEVKIGNHSSNTQNNLITPNDDEGDEDGYKSRVQFLTSGIVTVTNVVNDVSSLNLQNGHGLLQSLDFETEDSSLESQQINSHTHDQQQQQQNDNHNSVHRKANTIRIQVNYPLHESLVSTVEDVVKSSNI